MSTLNEVTNTASGLDKYFADAQAYLSASSDSQESSTAVDLVSRSLKLLVDLCGTHVGSVPHISPVHVNDIVFVVGSERIYQARVTKVQWYTVCGEVSSEMVCCTVETVIGTSLQEWGRSVFSTLSDARKVSNLPVEMLQAEG